MFCYNILSTHQIGLASIAWLFQLAVKNKANSENSLHRRTAVTTLTVTVQTPGSTAIVRVGRMCGGKDPVCETFCTNESPKIFESTVTNKGPIILSFALIRTDPFQKKIELYPPNFGINFQFTSLIEDKFTLVRVSFPKIFCQVCTNKH